MNRNSAAFSKKERKFHKKVLEKDSYLCQCCGNFEDLHVHHIAPVNQFPDLAFDIPNGIVLCKSCHNRYHRDYGYKEECNKETLQKFIDAQQAIISQCPNLEINWSYGLINKPYHQKTKTDFLNWTMGILKRCDSKDYLLIKNIFKFCLTHKCVTSEHIELLWQNFLHGRHDGESFDYLDWYDFESEEPFLLIHDDNNSILGVYTYLRLDLEYNTLIMDKWKNQILTDDEVNDLRTGKYNFITLSDIQKRQLNEVKQEKLWDCMLRRILNSFRRG